MTDGPSFSYKKLITETWYKKFVYKSHTEPSKFLERETRPMRDDKEFQILFFSAQHSIINKMAKKTKKYETTNNNQQRIIVKKQNEPLTIIDAAFQSRDSKFLAQNRTLVLFLLLPSLLRNVLYVKNSYFCTICSKTTQVGTFYMWNVVYYT